MRKQVVPGPLLFLALLLFLLPGIKAQAQSAEPTAEEGAYDSRFFDQLHRIFGRFRDSDLRRVFQTADPIQCAELVSHKGEWRTVAFFNEDRSLGEWCRENLEEVKTDLSVYTFQGSCSGKQGAIQLTTEFPIQESIEAYQAGKIELEKIDINGNAPVRVAFDIPTQSYVFDLPFLFLAGRQNGRNVYSLISPRRGEGYAAEVSSHWECKAVRSGDVTYRFLICRTATVSRKAPSRNQRYEPTFGASAYFILSDGKEASTSVSISFGREPQGQAPGGEAGAAQAGSSPSPPEGRRPPGGRWQTPGAKERLAAIGASEFRLRFAAQTWKGNLASPKVLSDQKILGLQTAADFSRRDSCEWRPELGKAAEPLLVTELPSDVLFSLQAYERNEFAPASVVFDMKSSSGARLGTLQCVFPGVESSAGISFERWVAIVGSHIALEQRK